MANKAHAGRNEKSDLFVTITKRARGGISLSVKSSVESMYGAHIRKTALEVLQRLGVAHAEVSIEDKGALDFVLAARLEAAVRELWPVNDPGVLPDTIAKRRRVKKDRLRRTRLYLPGNNPDLMLNAGLFNADCVILDLEDSVAPAEKHAARLLVRNSLWAVDFMNSERIVRINPLGSAFGGADLEMVLTAGPDTILLPKCETKENVLEVVSLLDTLEKRIGVKSKVFLMPLIETAKGALHAYEIASASERIVAICFGAEDFTADIGAERTVEGRESFVARSMIVLGAKAAGVQAIDTVFSDVGDMEGLVKSTEECVALGFEGKGVIHPAQIEPIHEAFAPSPEKIAFAEKVIDALERAELSGSGVVSVGTKMIDAPVVVRAKRTLALAKAMGLI